MKVTSPEVPGFGPEAGTKTTKAALAGLIKITRANGSVVRLGTGKRWKANLENTSHWDTANVVADVTDERLGDPGALPEPAAYLRRTLAIAKDIRSARLYVTALGSYRVFLNGSRVGPMS